jgi:high affinity sulfate transporter 1
MRAEPSPVSARRLLPSLHQLRHYDRAWLGGDVLAGISVAAYLVPQVMAYAEVAGLPAITGLWAILAPLAVYALLGSSRQLSIGPESTTALMTAAAVAPLAHGAPERYAAIAAAMAMVVGAFCVLGWLGRLGFLADLLSRPVLVGYMAGIAVLMVVSQLETISGISTSGDFLPERLVEAVTSLDELHAPTLVLSGTALLVLLVGQRLLPRSPGPLVVMLLAAALVAVFDLTDHGIQVIGDVPAGLPAPQLPGIDGADLLDVLLPCVGIMVVAYSDNVLTARAFARDEPVDNNQEFLALGAANLGAGVTQGFPVSSSASRTVIGDALGSRSQLYSLVALGVVLATLLFMAPVLETFPMAALGAVVVYAAIRLVDVAEMRRIAAFRRSELVLCLVTTAAVLVFGVLYGVLAAIGLSILALLHRVARPHDGILGYVPGVPGMHDVDDYPDAAMVPGLVVYRYDSPLFFANAEDFYRRAVASLDSASGEPEWFLLNAEANIEVDLTAVDVLERLRRTVTDRGLVFAVARVKQETRDDLAAAGLLDRVGDDRIFMTLPTAVAAYVQWYVARHGRPPPHVVLPDPPTTIEPRPDRD